jgi:hypothetical protein
MGITQREHELEQFRIQLAWKRQRAKMDAEWAALRRAQLDEDAWAEYKDYLRTIWFHM